MAAPETDKVSCAEGIPIARLRDVSIRTLRSVTLATANPHRSTDLERSSQTLDPLDRASISTSLKKRFLSIRVFDGVEGDCAGLSR